MKKTTINKNNGKSGQVVVEFGILVGFFILLAVGILDYGMYVYTKYNFENAVRNGVRASVKMQDWNVGQNENKEGVKDVILSDCAKLPSSWKEGVRDAIDISFEPNVANISYITVEINDYAYTPITGFVDFFIPPTISAKAVMRYEY